MIQGSDVKSTNHKLSRYKPLTQYYQNVLAANNTINPNYQVDFSADFFMIDGIMLQGISGIADLTTDLRSGLTEQASTWYYLWIFTEGTGSSYTWRFDTDATTPTYPDGFTKGRVLTQYFNNSGSNLDVLRHQDEICRWTAQKVVFSGGTATTPTTTDLSDYMPENSNEIATKFTVIMSSGGFGNGYILSYINGSYVQDFVQGQALAASSDQVGVKLDIKTFNRTIQYYKSASNVTSVSLTTYGFTINL
jgi:hypothetical protein